MASKVLITGAAGYIGGSILQKLLDGPIAGFSRHTVIAAVRSPEQSQALSRLGIKVVPLDLADSAAVSQVIDDHEVDIVVHTASSLDATLATNLIQSLGQRARSQHVKTYFVHTSGSSAFATNTGWPHTARDDIETIYDVEKETATTFPLRAITVVDTARDESVTSFIVVPSIVYGKGLGEWNRTSVVLPIMIKSFVKEKAVYKLSANSSNNAVHISDLVSMYELILERIVHNKPIESGSRGYYLAFAHTSDWHLVTSILHEALLARGLLGDPEVKTWPSDEAAAETLEVSVAFLKPLWTSGSDIQSTADKKLGWTPHFTNETFAKALEIEVDNVMADPDVKSSLIQALKR